MNWNARRRQMERKIVEKLRLGIGVNQITRELSIGKRRVMSVRGKAQERGYLDCERELPRYPEALFEDEADRRSKRKSEHWQALEGQLEWIKDRLASGWHAVTVYEELSAKVPRSSFYRFLARHDLNQEGLEARRVVPEIVHLPGEALLIDWGYLWKVEQNGRQVKLWVFIGVLGYSRYMVAKIMTSCTQTETLAVLGQMYQLIGGVPWRTTSDNPKVFALTADRFEPILHPLYERFASHYNTAIECLPPRKPEQKGKVERPVPYIRRLMEGYAGDRNDLEAIAAYLNSKLEIANQRRHGTTHERPIDRLLEEHQALRPLPVLPYEMEQYHEGTVRIDGHVRFQGKYYSLAEEFIRKQVSVIGDRKQVSIYCDGKLIETHERIFDRTRSKSTKRHHLKPWEQVCDNPNGLRGMAAKIGPAVESIVWQILAEGDGFINFRRVWGILALDKKYSNSEIDAACKYALR